MGLWYFHMTFTTNWRSPQRQYKERPTLYSQSKQRGWGRGEKCLLTRQNASPWEKCTTTLLHTYMYMYMYIIKDNIAIVYEACSYLFRALSISMVTSTESAIVMGWRSSNILHDSRLSKSVLLAVHWRWWLCKAYDAWMYGHKNDYSGYFLYLMHTNQAHYPTCVLQYEYMCAALPSLYSSHPTPSLSYSSTDQCNWTGVQRSQCKAATSLHNYLRTCSSSSPRVI